MDANRKPRKTAAPQMQEIASIANGRDITRGFVEGLLLYPQDKILQKLGWDYARYEAILTDDQVASCLQQRRTALLSREWVVEPADESRLARKAADFVRGELKRIRWDAVTEKMHYGVFYGFAVGECLWNREDDQIHLGAIKVRKQRRFRFGPEKDLRLLTLANMLRGEELPTQKFWHFCTGADNDDEPYGLGLGHWLYWPTLFKRGGWRAWLLNLQKTAGPTGLGKYQPGASEAEQKKLLQAVGAIQTEAGIILPEGMTLELLESSRTATADYGALDEACNAAISKVILSQTMTTDNGSSLSQAEVHAGVAAAVVKSDSDLINESFNSSVVQWLCDWNFPEAPCPKVWRDMSDAEDLNDRAIRDKALFDMGYRLTPEKLQEVYGEGYVDPASLQAEGEEERPPLVTLLGVGGMQALMTFFGQLPQLGLSPKNASAILANVFGITPEAAAAMLPDEADPAPVDPNAPAPAPTAPTASLDQAAALFGEAIEFAADPGGKKKNCNKGISCGGGCISAKKICRKELTPPQQEQRGEVIPQARDAEPKKESTKKEPQQKGGQTEEEVLVPKGAKYRVLSRKTKGNLIEVELEEID